MTTLGEIQARADASTEGPWEAYRDGLTMYVRDKEGFLDPIQTGYVGNRGTVTDAEFIAHARKDVPTLVAAIRAVEAVHAAGCGCPGCDCGGEDDRPLVCGTCNEYYPCPTITAIREALG